MSDDIVITIAQQCLQRNREFHHCDCCEHSKCCGSCTHSCIDCLEKMHWASKQNLLPDYYKKRIYDCQHMADAYVCKFAWKFASEFLYALEQCASVRDESKLRVLSFGCGPCTDLFAVDGLGNLKVLNYKSLEYLGLDYSSNGWKQIHHDLQALQNEHLKIRFYYDDISKVMHDLAVQTWVPHIISFQYVLSDMVNHCTEEQMHIFIDDIAKYINAIHSDNLVIILNDINLGKYTDKQILQGRDYFEELSQKLENVTVKRRYFPNDYPLAPSRGYPYGQEYSCNSLCFEYSDYAPFEKYTPLKYCKSAQMIIYKGEKAQK